MDTKNQAETLLSEFLSGFEQIPADITTALSDISSDADEKNIISAIAPSLISQFRGLSVSINEFAAKADKQSHEEVTQLLKVSSGVPLLNSLKLSLPSIGSLVGKLGIAEIVRGIKKIIRKIFELLNKKMPVWLDAVLLIIDEIIDMIFGKDSQKAMNMFAGAELNFLKQITQLTHLENATYRAGELSEDD